MDEAKFADLLARAKNFEDAAVKELVAAYDHEIRVMVRNRLPQRLRMKFDSMDFVQAVWASFFVQIRDRGTRFENDRQLGGFLAGIAKNKVIEEHRKRTNTRKYDIKREQQLYTNKGGREIPVEVISTDPSPSEQVQAKDCMEKMCKGEKPQVAVILALREEGRNYEEIADEVKLHERTVRRMVSSVWSRLEV